MLAIVPSSPLLLTEAQNRGVLGVNLGTLSRRKLVASNGVSAVPEI